MVNFILIRHGLTTFNKTHRYQGQYDSPLDEKGILQAECTAAYVVNNYRIDAIYASDLSRTRDTAAPFARLLGLPVHTSPALREVDVGKWSNRLVADVEKEEPDNVSACRNDPGHFRYPGGENFREVYDRASSYLKEIAKKHDGETVLVISHGGVIRTLVCAFSGCPIENLKSIKALKNTSITTLTYENDTFTLSLVGSTDHLPEELM